MPLFSLVLSLIVVAGLASVTTAQVRLSEFAPPVCDPDSQRRGLPAGFEIDGDVLCGTAGGADWIRQNGCDGVVFPDGSVCRLDSSFPFSQFFVDPNWAIGFDTSIFRGMSNKNNDDISPAQGWNWTGGNGYPQKNDITEVYATLVQEFDPGSGEINRWLLMAASTRASEGSEHLDFEWNTAGFTQTGSSSGLILGGGPDAGRLAGTDFIISVDFANGGVRPLFSVRIWNGQEFCELGDAACASLSPRPFPDGVDWFAATNCDAIPTICNVTDPDGMPAPQYEARQFVEFAINLTRLGIEELGDPFAPHIIVKTRSSASFTAELKDFALVSFVSPPPPVCTIAPIRSGAIGCGDTLTFCSEVTPSGGAVTYDWTVTGGSVVGSSTDPCVTVQAGPNGGTLAVSLSVTRDGIPALEPCEFTLPVDRDCAIVPFNPLRTLSPGDTASYCVTLAPPPQPGASVSYRWTVTGATPIGSVTGPCVKVTVGTTNFSLAVDVVVNGCAAVQCDTTIVIDVDCSITAKTLTDIACGDTASFCARVTGNGSLTYLWTVTGGTIIGANNGLCVRVRAGAGSVFQLVFTTRRNGNVVATCTLDVPIRPAACVVSPIRSVTCLNTGDTLSFCSSVSPPVQPGGSVTFNWSVIGGSIVGPANQSCVKIQAGTGASVTVNPNIVRNAGCPTLSCPVSVPICPPIDSLRCNIVPVLPDRAAICGDTLSYCAQLKSTPPPGATVTFLWAVTGGQILGSPTAPCVTVRAGTTASEFRLTLTIRVNGITADECDITIPIGTPKCIISAVDPTRVLACGDTASFCVAVVPGGGTITYSWTVTGGFIETSPTAQCVRVRAGTNGQVTIRAEVRRNNCPTTCEATIPLVPVVCEIVPLDPTRTLACGDTVTFCAAIQPPGGTRTYNWTITNGTILTSPTASCVRVKLGTTGDMTLRLEARRNGCLTTCERTVSSGGLKCEVAPFNPARTLACGDTATFCAQITPAGPGTTYQWTVVGGTIDGSSSGSCVRVIAGQGTEFTITVNVQRMGYCGTTCERTVPLVPLSCEVSQLDPNRVPSCGDTVTFVASILPPGGVRTYQWTVVNGTLLTSPSLSAVRVKLGTGGNMVLTLNATRNGCLVECSRTVSTSELKCDIVPFNPNRALACGDTATYCAVIEPAGPNTTYEWTIVGGTIETSPTAQCVRVKVRDPGTAMLTVTARRNLYCPTTCTEMIPVSPLKCEIVPADPNRVFACGDTASFCVNVFPGSTAGATITWTITGGVILSPSTAPCVRVRFGTTGTFTLNVEISRGGKCITSCDRTFPIAPLECEIRRVDPDLPLVCGDSASFCVTANASGVTYEWTVINGVALTPLNAQCIQVRSTGGGDLIVRATVRRNDCVATCEYRVPTTAPICAITGPPSLCSGQAAQYCTPVVPGATYLWTISGNGTLTPPVDQPCVTATAGSGTGSSFRLIVRVTQGTCVVACTTNVQVRKPPVVKCEECEDPYPDDSILPMSKGVIDHDMVMRTFDPKTAGSPTCVVTDTLLRVYYSSDRVMLLGFRQVRVITSSGTTTTNFPVGPVPTTPMCIREPNIGDTISTGDLRYGDWYERPVFPALWITDITDNPSSRAGDFAIGITENVSVPGAIPPDKVCGLWKYAVRSYDKTRSGGPRATTISDYPDPAKNFWNLGAGSDVPTEGFNNVDNDGYGAEAAWNLTNRGLVPGRTYRLFFSVYEGGDNPHPNYGCVNITIPNGDCPPAAPAATAANDTELQKPSETLLAPKPVMNEVSSDVRILELQQNQPNPFNRVTTIHFAVPERSHVSIRVYTVTGQEIAVLTNRTIEPGRQSVTWMPVDRTGRPLAPGVYLYKMVATSRSGSQAITRKMVLMK